MVDRQLKLCPTNSYTEAVLEPDKTLSLFHEREGTPPFHDAGSTLGQSNTSAQT